MSDPKTLGERALEVRNEVRKTQKEMAAYLGLSTATWQKIERNEGIPSGETLLAFEKLGINPGWVLSGLGPKRLNSTEPQSIVVDAGIVQEMHSTIERIAGALPGAAVQASNGFQPRPPKKMKYFSSIYASAGGGLAALHEAPGADLDAEGIAHELLGYDLDEIWLFPIKGDSMLSTFSHGDIVVVERWKGDDPEEGRIYVVSIKGEILAKRAHWDDGRLILQSDNSAYADLVVPDSEPDNIKVLGEVVWRFQPIRRRKA